MFLRKYQYKIKTVDELKDIIGVFPREKKVVMCHGVFDVVHPGHMRHLLYAKGKADILIASLTADRHINKGVYRPHVPQEIRAANLAAFEMVDYVIIDYSETPLGNIKTLQPDFFAKGYEYSNKNKSRKTQEEEQILLEYGGQMLFTPGDIVYSSSHLIKTSEPSLRFEKLAAVLELEKLGHQDLVQSLKNNQKITVHVIGDVIVDGIMQTNVIGGQIKTPTLSVRYEAQRNYVGGAGIVAKHLKAAGANVIFTTVLGDDALAKFVLSDLEQAGVKVNAIFDKKRPTTYKNAIVASGHRLVKVDTLDNSSISDDIVNKLAEKIFTTQADAVVFSDFRHGIFNRRTTRSLIEAIPKNTFKVADSQVASRWGNITEFKGFDLITPNEREARFALADQDSGVRPLAAQLYDEAECKTLILKLGERGLLTCCHADHEAFGSAIVVDSFANQVVDAVGSGDALLAYATLALIKGFSPVVASIVGSMAAACECEQDGNVPVTPAQVEQRINDVLHSIMYTHDSLEADKTNIVCFVQDVIKQEVL